MNNKVTKNDLLKALKALAQAVLTYTNATPDEWPELEKAIELIKNSKVNN